MIVIKFMPIGAITIFQKRIGGIVDGRVDQKGPTIKTLLDRHLSGFLDMIDLSHLSPYTGDPFINSTTLLFDPVMARVIQDYVNVLRKQNNITRLPLSF